MKIGAVVEFGVCQHTWDPHVSAAYADIEASVAAIGRGTTPLSRHRYVSLMREFSSAFDRARWDHSKSLRLSDKTPKRYLATHGDAAQTVACDFHIGGKDSSHLSANSLACVLIERGVSAAFLLLPSQELCAQLRPQRFGSFSDLAPYFDIWRNASLPGLLCIAAVSVS